MEYKTAFSTPMVRSNGNYGNNIFDGHKLIFIQLLNKIDILMQVKYYLYIYIYIGTPPAISVHANPVKQL